MKIGIDLVKIADLKSRLREDVTKVFTSPELESSGDKLAGVFAVKEAFFKALGRKEDWLSVWVSHEPSGKPIVHTDLLKDNEHIETSISYAGEYVVAVVIIN